MSGILKKRDKKSKQNDSKREWEAIDQLKIDDSIMILQALGRQREGHGHYEQK